MATTLEQPSTGKTIHLDSDRRAATALAQARRQMRVKLLRDLVAHGLYVVDTGALAERLITAGALSPDEPEGY